MANGFEYYFNRAADLEAQARNRPIVQPSAGMPATAVNVSAPPSNAPAQPPVEPTSDNRALDFGVRNVSAVDQTTTLDNLGIGTTSSGMGMFKVPGMKKGTARVPGKGNGKTDTVPAMLAPGEAVLNKAAADGMGRGLISALNKMGAKKMGLV